MKMLAPAESTVRSRGEFLKAWYRGLLAGEIRRRLPAWEKRTGLRTERFAIRDMNRSWGRCNPAKRSVVFNLQLARKPKDGLDYVILHELCHLRHPGHGKDFVSLLSRFMPDWRAVRTKLNEAPLDFVLEDSPGPPESDAAPPRRNPLA